MRSPEEVFEDIENDRAHREREIRLIENIAARTESESEANMLRGSLVLLTYAHFEGFCKFALLSYASAINALGLSCRDATTPLVAASRPRRHEPCNARDRSGSFPGCRTMSTGTSAASRAWSDHRKPADIPPPRTSSADWASRSPRRRKAQRRWPKGPASCRF